MCELLAEVERLTAELATLRAGMSADAGSLRKQAEVINDMADRMSAATERRQG